MHNLKCAIFLKDKSWFLIDLPTFFTFFLYNYTHRERCRRLSLWFQRSWKIFDYNELSIVRVKKIKDLIFFRIHLFQCSFLNSECLIKTLLFEIIIQYGIRDKVFFYYLLQINKQPKCKRIIILYLSLFNIN